MRTIFLCVIVALAASQGAKAQESSYPIAPTPPSGPNFSGLEVGGSLASAMGGAGSLSTKGVGGNGFVDFNLQNGPIVGGAEADLFLGNGSGIGGRGQLSQNTIGSVRARGGFAFGNGLAFAAIGPAWSDSTFKRLGFSDDKALRGYSLGFGGEVALTQMILLRAEWRHYDFNSVTYYMPSGTQKLSTGTNMLLVGSSLHF